MTAFFLPLALALSPAWACAVPAPRGEAAPAASSDEPESARPLAGELRVGERVFGELELQRALILTHGRRELDRAKLDVHVQREIARRLKAGEDPADWAVDRDEIARLIEGMLGEIRQNYPGVDPDEILAQNGIDRETWPEQHYKSALFNALFLPADPDAWPEVAREGMKRVVGEDRFPQLFEQMKAGYDQRLAQGLEVSRENQAQFHLIFRPQVIAALNERAEIEGPEDGLDPRYVLRVEGVPIETAALWEVLAPELSLVDTWRTRRRLAKELVVERELRRLGAWQDDEAFTRSWDEFVASFEGSILPMEQVLLGFDKRFPSVDHFRRYYRLLRSYEDLIEDELGDEAVQAHLTRAERFLGLGTVDCEVLLVSAYDAAYKRWRPDGWRAAREDAEALSTQLDEGAEWGALLEEHSQFYDPPLSDGERARVSPEVFKDLGRFGKINRTQLAQKLGESDYLSFVLGESLAETIFYTLEEGAISAPLRGPEGYYLVRVAGREGPRREIDLENADDRRMVREDLLKGRFLAWSEGVLQAALDEGLVGGLDRPE